MSKRIFLLLTVALLLVFSAFADTVSIADIQNNFASYDGQEVTIHGIVTIGDGLLYSGKTKIYVQDDSGRGVLLFNNSPLATTYVRGDEIEVTGTVDKYNSDVEITNPVVSLISQGNALPTAYSMTGSEAEIFNGTWATATGTINDVYAPANMVKITIDVNGTDIPLVFWATTGADVSQYGVGDEVVASGVITFYNGAIQLTCGYDTDISIAGGGEDVTPPQLVSASASSTTEVLLSFNEALDPENISNTANYSISGLTVESALLAENAMGITLTTSTQTTGESYTVIVSNVEDIAGNIIADNNTANFTGYTEGTTITIADIQNNFATYDGQEVSIEAVVTIGDGLLYPGKTKFYIQDDSGRGIQVFNNSALATTYVRGDKIQVTGTVTKYNSDVEITSPVVTLISQGNDLPTAYSITGSEAETFNGTWGTASGEINDVYDQGTFVKITIDVDGTDLALMFWDTTGADVSGYQVGDNVDASGVITYFNSVMQVVCGYDTDINISGAGDDTTPPQLSGAIANSSTEVTVTFNEAVTAETAEVEGNYAINGLTVSAAALNAGAKTVTLTTSAQTEGTSYTVTVSNVADIAGNVIAGSNTATFTGYIEGQVTTIATIQNNFDSYNGQEVTIQGVVTIGDGLLQPGRTKFYIQDDSGRGIQVYKSTSLATTYVRGDKVQITGVISLYDGGGKYHDVQIAVSADELISTGNELPTAYALTGSEGFELNGTWAKATGVITNIWNAHDTYGFYQITVTTSTASYVLQFWDSTGADVSQYLTGDTVEGKGVIAFYNGAVQLTCAYSEDLVEKSGSIADTFKLTVIENQYFRPENGEVCKISIGAPANSLGTLRLFNSRGQEIRTIYDTESVVQMLEDYITFDGRDEFGKLLNIGTYFINWRVTTSDGSVKSKTKPIVIGAKL